MVKTTIETPEFEQRPYREIEQKYLPLFDDHLQDLRASARPIEQFYLSHPSEPFNLRFRESLTADGSLRYEATLKDRGTVTDHGIDRLEVTTEVSPEIYAYYKTDDVPCLRKLRAEPNAHVAVDYFEDGRIIAESEHPIAWSAFLERYGRAQFVEITGDRWADNEWNAHIDYRRRHDGAEAFDVQLDVDIEQVAIDVLNAYARSPHVLVQIAGRSGSGKSTIVKQLEATLEQYALRPVVLSTDDYHRGNTWLESYNNGQPWTEWDAAIVYDTEELVSDIARLQAGEAVPRRAIDFTTVEPAYRGTIQPSPVIIVEGIYAGCDQLSRLSSLRYDMPTPLATCIGRRLLRDLKERPQFADPAVSLRYMLENAEPSYRAQEAAQQP